MTSISKRENDYCINGCINTCCGSKRRKTEPSPDTTAITILDVLEVDICRHAILDHLSLGEILRSETVCKRWQNMMHHYVRGSQRVRRRLHISAPWHDAPLRGALPLAETTDAIERSLYKWGTSIVAAPCTAYSFAMFAEYCPNIKELTFYGMPDPVSVKENIENVEKLEKITFKNCHSATDPNEQHSDQSVRIFLEKETIKEVTIVGNNSLTGACFTNIQTNLTSLRIRDCPALDYKLLCINFKELSTLELTRNSSEIMQNIHLVLENAPKLEHLELCWYNEVETDFLQVLYRLDNLKHIILRHNDNVDDSWLHALAKRRELKTLDVSYCKGLTYTGLMACLRGIGRSLEALGVAGIDVLTNLAVETFIRLCPNIKALDLENCYGLTSGLISYLSRLLRRRARWRLPLIRVRVRGTGVTYTSRQPSRIFIMDWTADWQLLPKDDESEPRHVTVEEEGRRRWFMNLPLYAFLGEMDREAFEGFRVRP